MSRYKWIAARKAEGFPVTMACKIAGVSRQAFGDWRKKRAHGPSGVEVAEAELVAVMRDIHVESDSTYGQPRMTPELRARGFCVNHKRVERLMREHHIVGVHKPTKIRTTIPAENNAPMPDLVGRRFAPGKPDVAWVGDITYRRIQPVEATPACWRERRCSSKASAGVRQSRILRGRELISAATALRSLLLHLDRSVPFGKY